MKRPDIDIVRRALKTGRHVVGDLRGIDKIIKPALDLPLVYLADQFFVETPMGKTFCSPVSESLEKLGFSEPVFDEWVINIKERVYLTELGEKGRNGVHRDANIWACFFNADNPLLFDLHGYPKNVIEEANFPVETKFATLLVEYESEPLVSKPLAVTKVASRRGGIKQSIGIL